MKRSLSAPDLPFPLSRSVAVKRQEVEKQTLYQTHCRVIPWCQYYVLGRVSAGGKRVITIKHQPTQTLTHAAILTAVILIVFLYNSYNLCLVVFPGSGGCEHTTEGALPRQ